MSFGSFGASLTQYSERTGDDAYDSRATTEHNKNFAKYLRDKYGIKKWVLDALENRESMAAKVIIYIGDLFQCTEDEIFSRMDHTINLDLYDLTENPVGKLTYLLMKKSILAMYLKVRNIEDPILFCDQSCSEECVEESATLVTGMSKKILAKELAEAKLATKKYLRGINAEKYTASVWRKFREITSEVTGTNFDISVEKINEIIARATASDIIPCWLYSYDESLHNTTLMWLSIDNTNWRYDLKDQPKTNSGQPDFSVMRRTENPSNTIFIMHNTSDITKLCWRLPDWSAHVGNMQGEVNWNVEVAFTPSENVKAAFAPSEHFSENKCILFERQGNIFDGGWPPAGMRSQLEVSLPPNPVGLYKYDVKITGQRKFEEVRSTTQTTAFLSITSPEIGIFWKNFEKGNHNIEQIEKNPDTSFGNMLDGIANAIGKPRKLLEEAYARNWKNEQERINLAKNLYLLLVHKSPPLSYLIEKTKLP
jgi:hypothetical protein